MKSPHPGDFNQPSERVFRNVERQSPSSRSREDPVTLNQDERGRARTARLQGRPRRRGTPSHSRSRSSGSAAKRLANSRPRSKMRASTVSQFEADLSIEQKFRYNAYKSQATNSPPVPRDVMRLTAEIDLQSSGKTGRRRCFGPRLTNFLQSVQQFAALGDIIVGGSQNLIACGVWALVRLSLLSIVKFSTYLDKLSTLIMTVGRSAPRYQSMALVYPHSTELQSHLNEYFIVVVHLCHQILKFTQKSTLGQFVHTLSDSDTKKYEPDLDNWARSIKEEVNLLMAKRIEGEAEKNSLSRVISGQSLKYLSHEKRLKANRRVLNLCSTYDYEMKWKQFRKIGNATVFYQDPCYRGWKGSTESSTLIYTGRLGSGKSIMMANIVDDLNLRVRDNMVVAYFFCRYDMPESLQARTIIGSLARQLLLPIQDLTEVGELFDRSILQDVDSMVNLLKAALPSNYKAYFVLDGLDECDHTESKSLVRILRELQETFTLLLCVSLRLDPNNDLNFNPQQFVGTRLASIPIDNPDIEAFIEEELANRIESKSLVIGNPNLALEIKDALLAGSQGMFLWVALQIESLCTMNTDEDIRLALEDLPRDLSETFYRILRRHEESGKPYQRLILELIAVAYRPLTTKELREVLSTIPGDILWNPARILNNIYSTLACCGSLITVDEEDLTVQFVHHSVKQFLLDGFADSTNIPFTISNAHKTMTNLIITYLNYGVFERQLSTVVTPNIMVGSTPTKVIKSTLRPSPSAQSLALKLLKANKHINLNIGKTLKEMKPTFHFDHHDTFHFYTYAKAYWAFHTMSVPDALGQEPYMHDLLYRMLQRKVVDVNAPGINDETPLILAAMHGREAIFKTLLSSDANPNSVDIRGMTPLLWAARCGHEAIIQILLGLPLDHTKTKDVQGLTPLSWAARNGQDAAVKRLLAAGFEADSRDVQEMTPLLWAARNGHEAIVRMLFTLQAVNIEAKDIRGMTPLTWAARNGHIAIVRILLLSHVKLEPRDTQGMTPLSWAAHNGHEAVVDVLSASHVELDCRDAERMTPLSWAARNGHESIVGMLLASQGVNIEARDIRGMTPLAWASHNGHETIVRLLLYLAKSAEHHLKDHVGMTPMLWAARNGHETIVKTLVGSHMNANIEAKDIYGMRPLAFAAMIGHEAVVRALLDLGANPDMKDLHGFTALSWAAQNGHTTVVRILSELANVNSKTAKGQTPLALAARNGHYDVVASLLNLCDADSKDNKGRTPLWEAIVNGHADIARLLIHSGKVDVTSLNIEGHTPLTFSSQSGHADIVQALLYFGRVDPGSRTADGRTPISLAAGNGHASILETLIDSGADVKAADDNGMTALSWAAFKGHDDIVRILLSYDSVKANFIDSNGRTPLSLAIYNNQISVVGVLLASSKVDIHFRDSKGRDSLALAESLGREDIVRLLEQHQS